MSIRKKERGFWGKIFGAVGAVATMVESTAEAGVTASRGINEYASSFEADAVNSFCDNLELSDKERRERLAIVEARKELAMDRMFGSVGEKLAEIQARRS